VPEVIQFTPNPTSSPSPLREFAREAVDAVTADRVQLVLRRRIEQHLALALRLRLGLPLCSFDQLSPGERTWCTQQAAVLVAIAESIHADAPPTEGELRYVDAQRALQLAQSTVRCQAVEQGHELRGWRPAAIAGYQENFCERCGVGARIHVATTGVSIAPQLSQPCPQRRAR
jgi:hypothetical protein